MYSQWTNNNTGKPINIEVGADNDDGPFVWLTAGSGELITDNPTELDTLITELTRARTTAFGPNPQ